MALIIGVPVSNATEADPLHGSWGNEQQCAGALVTPKGTKHAAPFIISTDWLKHDEVWCRLTWLSNNASEDNVSASAFALCGEDTDREYQLKFELNFGELSIFWNLFHKNGPLRRCE